MKMPDREPRCELWLEKYTYYDDETVVQEDGQIAKFTWNNKEREKGWQFSHWEDKYGFQILPENQQTGEFAKKIFDSEVALSCHTDDRSLSLTGVSDNENLHEYKYGGVFSARGGLYITPKNNQRRVLRVKQLWMS